jgi:hypothetical protein
MARQPSLRAADADREAVTERLREAAAEGRLEPDELEDRVHTALRARTYGELERVVADLPAARTVASTALDVATRAAVLLVMLTLLLVDVAVVVTRWLVWALMRAHGFAAARVRPHPGRPAA